jgi:cellulose synthase/poly-beta-1,6-N-acetylglucosamine synthase-like glycosyltransferase
MHLGYGVISPRECRLTTEVMESWGELYRQRLRWKRGALENLRDYGLTRTTFPYWCRQLFTLLGILATAAYLASLVLSLALDGSVHVHPLWLAVTAIFVIERIVTVRSRGPVQMLLAAVLVVEMTFDVFLQLVHTRAIWDTLARKERNW